MGFWLTPANAPSFGDLALPAVEQAMSAVHNPLEAVSVSWSLQSQSTCDAPLCWATQWALLAHSVCVVFIANPMRSVSVLAAGGVIRLRITWLKNFYTMPSVFAVYLARPVSRTSTARGWGCWSR